MSILFSHDDDFRDFVQYKDIEITGVMPCPFCGFENPKIREELYSYFIFYYVICPSCMARGGSKHNKKDAVELWNLRSES